MSRLQNVAVFGGLAAVLAFFTATRTGAKAVGAVTGALSGYGSDGALSIMEVQGLAENMAAVEFPQLSPQMLVGVAWIESSFRPTAFRLEPHVGDASVGLMQTLGKTAAWLWDIGYRSVGNGDRRPDVTDLVDPTISMYFGGAYLHYLSGYGGAARDEQWIIRAYNGGPGGANKSYTEAYWAKYQAARAKWG